MTPRRLLTGDQQVRAALIVLAVGCAIVVAVLGVHYAGDRHAGRFDSRVDRRLRLRALTHLRLLHHVVFLAGPGPVVVICAVLVAAFAAARRYRVAALAVCGPGVAAALTEWILKPLVGRRIGSGLAFPSGHTTGTVALAGVLIVFLLGPSRPPIPLLVRLLVCLAASAWAVLVAISLVGVGDHYATDTIGGLGVSIATVIAVSFAIDAIADSHQPAPTPRPSRPADVHAVD
jgi:membrane-associated phospholipid phosphatase